MSFLQSLSLFIALVVDLPEVEATTAKSAASKKSDTRVIEQAVESGIAYAIPIRHAKALLDALRLRYQADPWPRQVVLREQAPEYSHFITYLRQIWR